MVSGSHGLLRKCVLDSNLCEAAFRFTRSNGYDAAARPCTVGSRRNATQRMAFGQNRGGTKTFGSAAARGGVCLHISGDSDVKDAGGGRAIACLNWFYLCVLARFLVHANEDAEWNGCGGNVWFDQFNRT